jgi:hypothetical protein
MNGDGHWHVREYNTLTLEPAQSSIVLKNETTARGVSTPTVLTFGK